MTWPDSVHSPDGRANAEAIGEEDLFRRRARRLGLAFAREVDVGGEADIPAQAIARGTFAMGLSEEGSVFIAPDEESLPLVRQWLARFPSARRRTIVATPTAIRAGLRHASARGIANDTVSRLVRRSPILSASRTATWAQIAVGIMLVLLLAIAYLADSKPILLRAQSGRRRILLRRGRAPVHRRIDGAEAAGGKSDPDAGRCLRSSDLHGPRPSPSRGERRAATGRGPRANRLAARPARHQADRRGRRPADTTRRRARRARAAFREWWSCRRSARGPNRRRSPSRSLSPAANSSRSTTPRTSRIPASSPRPMPPSAAPDRTSPASRPRSSSATRRRASSPGSSRSSIRRCSTASCRRSPTSRIPLPLGGTSNHFRRDALEEFGGWDPFNVTEDADLGIRLARCGYRSETLRLPTYEDAPTEIAVVDQAAQPLVQGLDADLAGPYAPPRRARPRDRDPPVRRLQSGRRRNDRVGAGPSDLSRHASSCFSPIPSSLWRDRRPADGGDDRRQSVQSRAGYVATILLAETHACAPPPRRAISAWLAALPLLLAAHGGRLLPRPLAADLIKPHMWEKTPHRATRVTCAWRRSAAWRGGRGGHRTRREASSPSFAGNRAVR